MNLRALATTPQSPVAIATLVALGLVASVALRPASADWIANGLPVAPADSAQIAPRLVPDGASGMIVAWEDERGGPFLAYAQHLTSDGSIALGWEPNGLLLPNRGFSQSNLTMVSDGTGGVYVASDDHGFTGAVVMQHLDVNGAPSSGWSTNGVVIQGTGGRQGGTWGNHLPTLELDGAGGIFLSWTYRDRFQEQVMLDRLTGAGAALGWSLGGTYAGWLPGGFPWEYPSVMCTDGEQGVFLAFQNNTIPPDLFVEHLGSAGSPLFGTGVPVCSITHGQSAPGIVSDGAGGAIVVWQDRRNGQFDETFAQHILADRSYAPGWPDTALAISSHPTAPGIPSNFTFPGVLSSVVSDGAGGAYVAWTDFRADPAGDIYAQHVLGNGSFAPGWPAAGLAISAAFGGQTHPTVSEDGAGGLLVCWEDARNDSGDIYVQHVDGAGAVAPSWPTGGIAVCTAEGSQVLPRIVNDGAGGAIVAWEDNRGSVPQIYASHVTYDGVVPTLAALASLRATSERVNIVWFAGSSGGPITIERNAQGSGWNSIASVRADGTGRVAYEDRDVVPGARYGYRLGLTNNGIEIRVGETWVTVPGAAFTLQAIRPNPIAAGVVAVMFAVPTPGRVSLDVLDVGGRRVASRQINASHAGSYTEALGEFAVLPTGMYVIRLSQAGRSVAERACVVH